MRLLTSTKDCYKKLLFWQVVYQNAKMYSFYVMLFYPWTAKFIELPLYRIHNITYLFSIASLLFVQCLENNNHFSLGIETLCNGRKAAFTYKVNVLQQLITKIDVQFLPIVDIQ